MSSSENNPHWSEQIERGSYAALRFMLFLYRAGGKWICYVLVYPISFYFFLTGTRARHASRQYLKHVYDFAPDHAGFKKPPGTRETIAHFFEFGRSCMDRLSAWTGDIKRADLIWSNRHIMLEHVRQQKGGVLIGAHLGCMDLMRGIASQHPELKFNALVFIDHAPIINQMFEIANPGVKLNLISVKSFTPDVAMLMVEKVEKGEFIVILGDRSPAGARDRVEYVPFLGEPAPWPTGPMILTSLLRCPVFLIFCLRKKGRQYEVFLEPFEDENLALPRKSRDANLHKAIDRYARVVEKYCCREPYQWFNFYDFWGHRKSSSAKDDPPGQPDVVD